MQREHSLKINFINKNIVIDNLVSNILQIFGNKKLAHTIIFYIQQLRTYLIPLAAVGEARAAGMCNKNILNKNFIFV